MRYRLGPGRRNRFRQSVVAHDPRLRARGVRIRHRRSVSTSSIPVTATACSRRRTERDPEASFVGRVIRKDGTVRWFERRQRRVVEEENGREYLEATLRDITAQREVMEALRDSQLRFSTAFAPGRRSEWQSCLARRSLARGQRRLLRLPRLQRGGASRDDVAGADASGGRRRRPGFGPSGDRRAHRRLHDGQAVPAQGRRGSPRATHGRARPRTRWGAALLHQPGRTGGRHAECLCTGRKPRSGGRRPGGPR